MLELALALALTITPVNSADEVVSAPTFCADPYAYRPWVRVDVVRDIIAESERSRADHGG